MRLRGLTAVDAQPFALAQVPIPEKPISLVDEEFSLSGPVNGM